jgi:hypothetical protein
MNQALFDAGMAGRGSPTHEYWATLPFLRCDLKPATPGQGCQPPVHRIYLRIYVHCLTRQDTSMAQITLYLDKETAAKASGLSQSKWVTKVIRQKERQG